MKSYRCVAHPLRVEFRWNELPGSFRVSLLMGLIGAAYQAWRLAPWTLVVWSLFAGPLWGEGFLRIIYLALVTFALAGVPALSVAGAISLLTLPLTEDHRGILAFFVMISSTIPIFFLAFDILNLVVSVWPLMVFAVPWLVLLWMGVRILRTRSVHHAQLV